MAIDFTVCAPLSVTLCAHTVTTTTKRCTQQTQFITRIEVLHVSAPRHSVSHHKLCCLLACLTISNACGRSVWPQHVACVAKPPTEYKITCTVRATWNLIRFVQFVRSHKFSTNAFYFEYYIPCTYCTECLRKASRQQHVGCVDGQIKLKTNRHSSIKHSHRFYSAMTTCCGLKRP